MDPEPTDFCRCRHRAAAHSGHFFPPGHAGGTVEVRGRGPCHVAGCPCPEFRFHRAGQDGEEAMQHGG